uniref:DUF4476 domain-containing protein n=1 Tax=candidate division WOR-3 bacterium TaxID=2052148 RepID=A0A7V3ZXI0_UNCW3
MLKILLFLLTVQTGIDTVIVKTIKGEVPVRVFSDRGKTLKSLPEDPELITKLIKEDLRILQKDYISRLPGEHSRRNATALIFEIEDLVNVLYLYSLELEEQYTQPKPMTEESFQKLLEQVQREWNTQNKLAILEVAAINNYFSTDQIVRIMRSFYSDDDKIEAVKITVKKIADRENLYLLLNEVTFSRSKEELRKLLQN